jgi:hypothetical protein
LDDPGELGTPMAAKWVRKDFGEEFDHIGSGERVMCALRKGELQEKEVLDVNFGKSMLFKNEHFFSTHHY